MSSMRRPLTRRLLLSLRASVPIGTTPASTVSSRHSWLVLLGSALAIGTAGCQDDASSARDWFVPPDRRAQSLFDRGRTAEAAALFRDPMRSGAAWYRSGEFKRAAAAFGQVDSPEGWYNRGNALLMGGSYPGAIESYRKALGMRPAWVEAQENLELALARRRSIADGSENQDEATGQEPDAVVLGGKTSPGGQETAVDGGGVDLSDPAMRAMWLRRVQTTPQDFLKAKFAFQAARDRAAPPVETEAP